MYSGVYPHIVAVREFFPTANVSVDSQDWGLAIRVWEPLRHRLTFEVNIMGAHVSWSVTEAPYAKACTIESRRVTIDRLDRASTVYDAMALQAVEAYQTFTQLVRHFQQQYSEQLVT